METKNMNIHRFILPATVAATLHVALFWALPHEEYIRLIPIELGPTVPPPPPPPEDPITLLPTEKTASDEPFRRISGGPTPPELPEEIVTRKTDGPTIPIEPRIRGPIEITTEIPVISGPGEVGTPGGPGLPVFPSGELDRVPNAKIQIAPEYPFAMKSGGIDGSVVVEFDVDRTGSVVAARVLKSTHGEFEASTLRAVRKWRFEPGRKNGRTVPFRMVVPVNFHLNPD
jgi:protein TonB